MVCANFVYIFLHGLAQLVSDLLPVHFKSEEGRELIAKTHSTLQYHLDSVARAQASVSTTENPETRIEPLRGLSQIIFSTVSVIMTLWGGGGV